MNKAVIINLDNTLVKTKSGKDYFERPSDWEFITGIVTKLRTFSDKGYIICIVSNQGGISTGRVIEQDVLNRIKEIKQELEQAIGREVHSIYCAELESYHRKPNPGMAYTLALALELNLRNSYMIGSSKSDMEFAKNAYIGTYYDLEDLLQTNLHADAKF